MNFTLSARVARLFGLIRVSLWAVLALLVVAGPASAQPDPFPGGGGGSGGFPELPSMSWTFTPEGDLDQSSSIVIDVTPSTKPTYEGTLNISIAIEGEEAAFEDAKRVDSAPVRFDVGKLPAGEYHVELLFTELGSGAPIDDRFTFTVDGPPPPSITPTSLDNGKAKVEMREQFSVVNGSGNYEFAATGLPDGLSMDSDGLLTGTPPKAGTISLGVTASQDDAVVASTTIQWVIDAAPKTRTQIVPFWTGAVDPDETTSMSLSACLYPVEDSGGEATVTVMDAGKQQVFTDTVEISQDCAGFNFEPFAAGTYLFVVNYSGDDLHEPTTYDREITIGEAVEAPVLTITPSEIAEGTVGVAVDETFAVDGGDDDYSFMSPNLPGGLTLAADGHLTGVPTKAGSPSFEVTASLGDEIVARTTIQWSIQPAEPETPTEPEEPGEEEETGSGSQATTLVLSGPDKVTTATTYTYIATVTVHHEPVKEGSVTFTTVNGNVASRTVDVNVEGQAIFEVALDSDEPEAMVVRASYSGVEGKYSPSSDERTSSTFTARYGDGDTSTSSPEAVTVPQGTTVTTFIEGPFNTGDPMTVSVSGPDYIILGRYMPTHAHVSASLSAIEKAAGHEERPALDLWLDGTFGMLADQSSTGAFAIGAVGFDYMFSPQLIAGSAFIVDYTSLAEIGGPGTGEGLGITAVPYLKGQITDTLSYDLKAGLGMVTNSATPEGTYTDTLTGMRWLLSGSLTGSFAVDDWTFSPVASVSYAEQLFGAYTDGAGTPRGASTIGNGSLSLAPKLSHKFSLSDGATLRVGAKVSGALEITRIGDSWTFKGLRDGFGADMVYVTPAGASFRLGGDIGGWLTGGTIVAKVTAGVSASIN